MYTFDTLFLTCYVHGFCTILGTKNHISFDIKILRRSYKSIQCEILDIGLGNHLNPKWSSKCTIFMTGFYTKMFFCMLGEMLKFALVICSSAKELGSRRTVTVQVRNIQLDRPVSRLCW